MADGEVLINTKINTDGAKEDLKELEKDMGVTAQKSSESTEKIKKSFEEASKEIGEILADQKKETNQKLSEIANIYIETGADATDAWNKAARDVSESAKKQRESTVSLTDKIELQRKELKKLEKSYIDTAYRYGNTSEEAKKLGDEISRLSKDLEKNEMAFEEASEAAAEYYAKTSNATGASTSTVAGAATVLSGGNLIAGGIAGIASGLTQKALDMIADGGRALVDFGKQSIELGSDLQEVQNVVDVTFTSMSADVNQFAKDAARSAGLSETMAKKYTGTFGAMAKSFGFTEKEAFDMSTTLTQLTGDVASFYNLDHDEAYTKLKSVFTGETEALKELGVVMTQTALDQYAMEKGIRKTTAQMTEQEKVALRYEFVLEQLDGASGDFVRTQDSWANQTRILSLQWESFMASIGEGLIAVFTPALQFITGVIMPFLNTVADAFANALTPEPADELAASLDALGIEMGETIVNAQGVAVSQQELQQAIEATEASVEALKLEYNEAREAAQKSIDSQIGLLTELETKSDKTAREIVDNWKKQQVALQNYSQNMKKAIDMGLDEALVQQLSDGSQESMQILNEFVNGTGISVDDINREFQGVQKSKEIVASTMADIQTGTSLKLRQIAAETESEWGDMAGVVGASIRDMQNYINSLTGKQVYVDVIGRYNGSAIGGTGYTTGYNPYAFTGYSVEATSYVPYLAEGAVIPPNAPFTAVLGDQRNVYNLEGPEDMFRNIVREELGNTSNSETNELLWSILQAIQSGRTININGSEVFQTVVDENNRAIRMLGKSPLR